MCIDFYLLDCLPPGMRLVDLYSLTLRADVLTCLAGQPLPSPTPMLRLEAQHAERGLKWGCVCGGHLSGNTGGVELRCADCSLHFHSKCERLAYTKHELELLATRGTYQCSSCEKSALAAQGFDDSAGRFVYSCRFCGLMFEEEPAARHHGKRCASALDKVRWSCACKGERSSGRMPGSSASQCTECRSWFHRSCKLATRAG